jgi:hypothetical protein
LHEYPDLDDRSLHAISAVARENSSLHSGLKEKRDFIGVISMNNDQRQSSWPDFPALSDQTLKCLYLLAILA